MKYLKYFEENTREFGKFYWGVHTEPRRFRKELEKIDCPDRTIKDYLKQLQFFKKTDIIFVGVSSGFYSNTWCISDGGGGLIQQRYEYKGPILLSREELNEIETEEKIDKFNI